MGALERIAGAGEVERFAVFAELEFFGAFVGIDRSEEEFRLVVIGMGSEAQIAGVGDGRFDEFADVCRRDVTAGYCDRKWRSNLLS